jgi:hypothetical protein
VVDPEIDAANLCKGCSKGFALGLVGKEADTATVA